MSHGPFRRLLLLIGTLLGFVLTGCFNSPPQHGTALLLEVDTSGLHSDNERQLVLNAAREVLVRRVGRFGSRCLVQPTGTNSILVKVQTLPEQNLNAFRRMLLQRGLLEFCLVQQSASTPLLSAETEGKGYRRLTLKRKLPDGRTSEESYLLKQPPEMSGGVASAMVTRDTRDQPEIAFTLDSDGARRFAQITRDNIDRQLAIVLDGELQTAPVIRSPIETGNGVISGSFSVPEAFELATVLEAPLPAAVTLIKEETF